MLLKGVWLFKKTLDGSYNGGDYIPITFPESDYEGYQKAITLVFRTDETVRVFFSGHANETVIYAPAFDGWYDDVYRCMDFGEGTEVEDALYRHIAANATPAVLIEKAAGRVLLTQNKLCESNIVIRPQLQTRVVRENGDYLPDKGKAGFGKVIVQLPLDTLSITDNGLFFPQEGHAGIAQVQVTVDEILSFLTEESIDYRTEVPENALPIAEVLSFGGMTQTAENRFFAGRVSRILSAPKIDSWKKVQTVVRSGLARNFFQIGDQMVCNKGGQPLVWDIIGFDHDIPVDTQYTHSLTIQLENMLPAIMRRDAIEALFYCESELPAGTYHFTLCADYDIDHGGGKTYQFTLTQDVPEGGVLMFPWTYAEMAVDTLVSSYESQSSLEAIESVSVTEEAGGTALETLGECNHTHRIRFGSNNWEQTAIRQFLNSNSPAGEVWTPQTKWDRPPEWNATTAGFLYDLDEDFLEVIGEVAKRTALSRADGQGYKDLTEKFFLLSRSEAYAGNENGIEEGAPYEYYSLGSDLSAAGTGNDSNRIRYRGTTLKTGWSLRTPYTSNGSAFQEFGVQGELDENNAVVARGISPVCCIV